MKIQTKTKCEWNERSASFLFRSLAKCVERIRNKWWWHVTKVRETRILYVCDRLNVYVYSFFSLYCWFRFSFVFLLQFFLFVCSRKYSLLSVLLVQQSQMEVLISWHEKGVLWCQMMTGQMGEGDRRRLEKHITWYQYNISKAWNAHILYTIMTKIIIEWTNKRTHLSELLASASAAAAAAHILKFVNLTYIWARALMSVLTALDHIYNIDKIKHRTRTAKLKTAHSAICVRFVSFREWWWREQEAKQVHIERAKNERTNER